VLDEGFPILDAPFDAAPDLSGDAETQMELLTDALANGDRAYVAHALGTVVRARGGVAKVAKRAGIDRQVLERALARNGNVRLEIFLAVLRGMGWRLRIEIDSAA
jgi:probable addiction module antidote protein